MHEETLGRGADLSAVDIGREQRAAHRNVERRRGHDDEGIVARGFDEVRFELPGAGLRHDMAGLDAAGEGDHVGIGALDQGLANRTGAADALHDAGR